MTELALVLLALVLIEGLSWAPRSTLTLSRRPWGGVAARRPRALRDGGGHGLLLPEPWLPVLERFRTQAWPLVIAPAGLGIPAGRAVGLADARSILGWERAQQIRAVGSRLTLAERTLAEAGSARAARLFVDLLRRIAQRTPEQREAVIREALALSFDVRAVRRRARRLAVFLRPGRVLAWCVTANLFVTGPLLAPSLGVARVWPPWVIVHVVLVGCIVALLLRAARRVPDCGPEAPWQAAVILALYPPAAARYLEPLFLQAYAGLDPLAVIAALGGRAPLALAARARLIETHATPSDGEVRGWFAVALREEVERLAAREGLSTQDLLAARAPEPDARAYCPRCGTQYRESTGHCADCVGVALVARGPAPASEPEPRRAGRE